MVIVNIETSLFLSMLKMPKSDPGRPSRYHHGNLKKAMLQTAVQLIEQRGEASFTIRELALFANSGHDLVLVARNEQRLDRLAEELEQRFGVTVTVLVKDLSTAAGSEEILAELQNRSLLIEYTGQ